MMAQQPSATRWYAARADALVISRLMAVTLGSVAMRLASVLCGSSRTRTCGEFNGSHWCKLNYRATQQA